MQAIHYELVKGEKGNRKWQDCARAGAGPCRRCKEVPYPYAFAQADVEMYPVLVSTTDSDLVTVTSNIYSMYKLRNDQLKLSTAKDGSTNHRKSEACITCQKSPKTRRENDSMIGCRVCNRWSHPACIGCDTIPFSFMCEQCTTAYNGN